ncbi:hypothetical protein KA005_07815 [bacterium]|nr:hypothetical protein [bacterium]
MKLLDLKTKLNSAISGVDMASLYFDYLYFFNSKLTKSYPLAIWDITNLRGQSKALDTASIPDQIELDIYCIGLVTPESDLGDLRLGEWDDLEEDLRFYLLQVDALSDINILNKNDITEFEYYPAGFFSVDREIGVRYKVILKLWC